MLNKLAVFQPIPLSQPVPWLMENSLHCRPCFNTDNSSSAFKIWCTPSVLRRARPSRGWREEPGRQDSVRFHLRPEPAPAANTHTLCEADHKQEVILTAGSDAEGGNGVPSLRSRLPFRRLLGLKSWRFWMFISVAEGTPLACIRVPARRVPALRNKLRSALLWGPAHGKQTGAWPFHRVRDQNKLLILEEQFFKWICMHNIHLQLVESATNKNVISCDFYKLQ